MAKVTHPCASLRVRWSSYFVLLCVDCQEVSSLVSPLRNSVVHSSRPDMPCCSSGLGHQVTYASVPPLDTEFWLHRSELPPV